MLFGSFNTSIATTFHSGWAAHCCASQAAILPYAVGSYGLPLASLCHGGGYWRQRTILSPARPATLIQWTSPGRSLYVPLDGSQFDLPISSRIIPAPDATMCGTIPSTFQPC